MANSVYALTSSDWREILVNEGQSERILKSWVDGIYRDESIWKRHIAPAFLQKMKNFYDFSRPEISQILEAGDGTVKLQVRFSDQLEVETVLIPFHKRYTICLSTKVGCGMNCSFCYTGTQGLKRNLKASEMIGQYLLAYEWLKKKNPLEKKPSIVFMGQGEPLHNVDEVCQAVKIFEDPLLLGVGRRQMTLSTVGFIPGLEKIAEFPKINLALSLHSPFQKQREELIPISRSYPLKKVMEILDNVELLNSQFITYEYLLIKNFNTSELHAEALGDLLSKRRAIVNLIPFNPFPGSDWERPGLEEIENFRLKLIDRKLRVMVRTTKGDDILAACGQLKINKLARKYGSEAR